MLYATTRGKHDVVTAHKAAHTDCFSDGGLFVPFRMPSYEKKQLELLAVTTPAQIAADVLNLFFSCDMTADDLQQLWNEMPVKAVSLGRHLLAAELWRSSGRDVDLAVQHISDRICSGQKGQSPANWMHIAVRIALIFASYGEMVASGQLRLHRLFDVAVTTGDFAMPMAAWYARRMGLPIGAIICGCNGNGGFWDLLNRGEFSTGDVLSRTLTPEADIVVPRNLERLISATLDLEDVGRYLLCCSKGRTYTLSPEALTKLEQGMFAAVISDNRMSSIIPGVFRTRAYVLDPYAALAYGSLQDYRAMTGQTRPAVLLAERSPMRDRQLVSKLLKINDYDLPALIGR